MAKSDAYWRKTRRLTFSLLFVWVFTTFGLTWFARDANEILILGFPLGFYMAAQGTLVIYAYYLMVQPTDDKNRCRVWY